MRMRNYLLAGLGLCVFTLTTIASLNPNFWYLLMRAPAILALMTLVVVWNAYAAIHWTHPRSREDSMVLHDGMKWGLAIGCAWGMVAIVPINIFTHNDELGAPLWFLGLFSGLLLPFASGAAGAIKTGRVRVGMRVGFWSGTIGGLIGFLIIMAVGFPAALISSLRVSTDSSFWQSERMGNTLELAIYVMFLFGVILGVFAGTVGGWIGLRLYRTGESPVAVTPSIST